MIDDAKNNTKQEWYETLEKISEKLDNASDAGGGAAYDMDYRMAQQRDKIKAGYNESIADNIDAINPTYVSLLGKGRLNIYRALTEAAVSVRYQNLSINDQSLGNRAPGTEIAMQFSLKNLLSPVANLKVILTANSPFVEILNPEINVGNLTTLQLKSGLLPFRVKVLTNAPENHDVLFTLKYTGNNGNYTDLESYNVVVALDYLNVAVNQISTTLTSNGRVGYSKPNAKGGLGFVYKEEDLLYEAALMVAKSETQVMNNARFDNNYNDDFRPQQRASTVLFSDAAFEGTSIFSDIGSSNPIGLKITSKMVAFNTTGNDKYIIVKYELNNTSSEDLEGIYAGLFTDWDLDQSSANATKYDENNKIAYVYAKKNASYPYAGIKLLEASASPAYYPLSYQLPNSFLSDNIFSIAEKYKTLTSGIHALGLGHDTVEGLDVMFTLGSGPYSIPKNKTIIITYAFLAGDDYNDLLKVGTAAAAKYLEMNKPVITPTAYLLEQNYPNAAKSYTYIPISLPEKTTVDLSVYNILGKKVAELNKGILAPGNYKFYVDVSRFANGIYTYQLRTPNYKKTKKMIVAK